MRRCRRKGLCSDCSERGSCPAEVRRERRSRRPMADSASMQLMRRAAQILDSGWYTCEQLGVALYGSPAQTRSGRMSVMVRARRPVNRLLKMGVLAVRPGANGAVEYTLLPDGKEVLG